MNNTTEPAIGTAMAIILSVEILFLPVYAHIMIQSHSKQFNRPRQEVCDSTKNLIHMVMNL